MAGLASWGKREMVTRKETGGGVTLGWSGWTKSGTPSAEGLEFQTGLKNKLFLNTLTSVYFNSCKHLKFTRSVYSCLHVYGWQIVYVQGSGHAKRRHK